MKQKMQKKQIEDNFYGLRLFQSTSLRPPFHKNIVTAWFSISISSPGGSSRKEELSDPSFICTDASEERLHMDFITV